MSENSYFSYTQMMIIIISFFLFTRLVSNLIIISVLIAILYLFLTTNKTF